jgi:uncharacterized protein (TIGR03067 family)
MLCRANFAPAQDKAVEEDLNLLKGKWKHVWIIKGGGEKGKREKPSFYEHEFLTFFPKKGDFSKEQPEAAEIREEHDVGTFKFTIDPTKNPKAMDKKDRPSERASLCIYKFQGNELWIATGLEEKRPTSFSDKNASISIYTRK